MAWFSQLTRDVVSLTPEEIRPEPALLTGIDPGKTAKVIENSLDAARERLTALVAEDLRIQNEIARTRLSIAALEAAGKVLDAADPDFAEVEPVEPRGHVAELAAADLVIQDSKVIKSKHGGKFRPVADDSPMAGRLAPRPVEEGAA
jgi:hypothetical protein